MVGTEVDRRVLLSCEADVRVGGRYRFEFGQGASKPMVFFGRYLEVTPHSRLVWTNDESDDGAVTTVTFEEKGGRTLLVMHELHPSKEALDGAIAGMEGRDARDVRATGRASRHPRRKRRKVMKSSVSRSDRFQPNSGRRGSLRRRKLTVVHGCRIENARYWLLMAFAVWLADSTALGQAPSASGPPAGLPSSLWVCNTAPRFSHCVSWYWDGNHYKQPLGGRFLRRRRRNGCHPLCGRTTEDAWHLWWQYTRGPRTPEPGPRITSWVESVPGPPAPAQRIALLQPVPNLSCPRARPPHCSLKGRTRRTASRCASSSTARCICASLSVPRVA